MVTQHRDALGTLTGETRRKAWQTRKKPQHGEVDFLRTYHESRSGIFRVPFPAWRFLFARAQTGIAKRRDGLGELRMVFEQALVLGGRQGRELGARDGRPHECARCGHGRRVLVPCH